MNWLRRFRLCNCDDGYTLAFVPCPRHHEHDWDKRRVSVPFWDSSASGDLWRCRTAGCEKVLAR